MILVGWLRRPIVLGAKFDDCPRCHVAGPHVLIRQTYWFTIFAVPVMLLWLGHVLVCPECTYEEGVRLLPGLRAIRTRRLKVDRPRPGWEAARRVGGGSDPADWAAFGLAPGASADAITARWRDLAKELHPDAGGDPAAFVRMSAIRDRLVSVGSTDPSRLPASDEVFDPFIVNPRRGSIDRYTKVWAAIAGGVLVLGAIGAVAIPRTTSPVAVPYSGGFTPGPDEVAHRCWSEGTSLNGCQARSGGYMLFGSQTGEPVTCYFREPLPYDVSVSCR